MILFCLRRLRRGLVNLSALMVLSLGIALCGNASATNIIFDTAGNIVGSYVGPRSIAADWVYSGGRSGFGGGARAVSTGFTDVITPNGSARVPTTIGTDFTAARVAGIGVKVARAATGVGIAFTAYDIYNAIKDSGVATCAPPNFFCMPSPNDIIAPLVTTGWTDDSGFDKGITLSSGQAVCDWYQNNSTRFKTVGNGVRIFTADATPTAPNTASGRCTLNQGTVSEYPYSRGTKTCPAGFALGGSPQMCLAVNPTLIAATDAYIQDRIAAKEAADPAFGPRIMNAAKQAAANAPGLVAPNLIAHPDLPIDVVSPGYSMPSTTISTKQSMNPDGTTSTTTTTNAPTIAASNLGTNMTNTNIVYTTTNNYTYTTVNNSTGATTTLTEQKKDAPVPVPTQPAPVDMPKDYNREVTQKSIEQELKADGAPSMVDQESRVAAAKTANDTGISDALTSQSNGYEASKSGWFTWVWIPPSGSCSPFAGNVHGHAISWDLCPTILNIRDVLGWLFAIFGAIHIYGTLFRSNPA